MLVKPGLFFTDGNMTLELFGIRERSVGPAGTMCCNKTDRLVVDELLAVAAAAMTAAAAAETDAVDGWRDKAFLLSPDFGERPLDDDPVDV